MEQPQFAHAGCPARAWVRLQPDVTGRGVSHGQDQEGHALDIELLQDGLVGLLDESKLVASRQVRRQGPQYWRRLQLASEQYRLAGIEDAFTSNYGMGI